jgi:hypothetical protein
MRKTPNTAPDGPCWEFNSSKRESSYIGLEGSFTGGEITDGK